MIQKIKITAIAAVLGLIGARASADQTNLVQGLSIQLSGITQGQTTTSGPVVRTGLDFTHVGTGDVIKQLGSATGNSFSDAAKLVVITPLSGGSPTIAVRDAGNSLDVTPFFVYEQKSGLVTTAQTNVKTGRSTSTDYSIQRLALTDSTGSTALSLHFNVQGIAVGTSATSSAGVTRNELDAGVSGSGDQNGKLLILEGSFRIQGNTLEVVSAAPPPNT